MGKLWLGAVLAALGFWMAGCGGPGGGLRAGSMIELETRADGLVYRKGDSAPYTGQLVMTAQGSGDKWVSHYQNGVRHGQFAVFYADGRRKAEAVFNHGRLTTGVTWKPDGMEGSRVDGGNGTLIMFHPDGSRSRVSVYQDGRRVSRQDFPAAPTSPSPE